MNKPVVENFGQETSLLRQKNVLVTGASGFIGSGLISELEAAGYLVTQASRNARPGTPQALRLPSSHEPLTAFEDLLENVDHVVHLAAIHHAGPSVSAEEYHAANCMLTARLAQAADKMISGKLVFTSSIRAQCGGVFDGVMCESDPPHPTDDYGRAKLAAEAEIAAAMPRRNYTILRPVLVYGPAATGNFAKLARLAALPVPLPLKSLPGRRSLLDRAALCAAIIHCLREPRTDGEVFIVADQRPLTLGEMVSAMRRGMGHRPMLFSLPDHVLDLFAEITAQKDRKQRLYRDLVASSSKLQSTGWVAVEDPVRQMESLQRGTWRLKLLR
jgi:UDP-glucose 4-epimerase